MVPEALGEDLLFEMKYSYDKNISFQLLEVQAGSREQQLFFPKEKNGNHKLNNPTPHVQSHAYELNDYIYHYALLLAHDDDHAKRKYVSLYTQMHSVAKLL